MIDTIVLTLPQTMFRITDHHKFSPSTEGLFDPNGYYRLGGRSNMVCKQNPAPTELKKGIYKPRLTVTKRINRLHRMEIMMKIELSLPKLVFGNNFDELQDTDFDKVVSILHQKLFDMGVMVSKQWIAEAPVSSVHYGKNIPLMDYTTPYTYLEKLSKVNVNQRLELDQTSFRNGGHSLKFHANSYEVTFYDKLKDLQQAKVSEKRAVEKDNTVQLNLFDNFVSIQKKQPFEVLRMEVRLNKRVKLRQIFTKLDINVEPIFKNIFSKDISKKVLLHYLSEIEAGYPMLLRYGAKSAKDFLTSFVQNNPKAGHKKALYVLAMRTFLQEAGIRDYREITKGYSKASWYKLNNEIKYLNYPHASPFKTLRDALIKSTALRVVDFNHMLNNVKIPLSWNMHTIPP